MQRFDAVRDMHADSPYPTVLWQTCTEDLRPLEDALIRIRSMIDARNGGE